MKIAITGSACTGKTTLARQLAGQLGLQCIPEQFELFFSQPRPATRLPPEQLGKLFHTVLEQKRAEEQKLGSYITDRCPLDLFNLWLAWGLLKKPRRSARFYRLCRQYMTAYDAVILLPWGTLPFKPLDNPAGRQIRAENPWQLLRNHATIQGLAYSWVPRQKIIQVPEGLADPARRLQFVMRRLKLKKAGTKP